MVGHGLARLEEVGRTIGWTKALCLAPVWAVWQRYLVLTRDLRCPLPELVLPSSLRITRCGEADVALLAALNPLLSEAGVHRRWRNGQECYLGWWEGVPVHYRWYGTRAAEVPGLGVTLHPSPGDHIVVEAFTHPRLRRKGLSSAVAVWTLHHARQEGRQRAVTIIAWWNTPSLRVARRSGYEAVGTLTCWRVGKSRRYGVTGSLRLAPATPPAIRLA